MSIKVQSASILYLQPLICTALQTDGVTTYSRTLGATLARILVNARAIETLTTACANYESTRAIETHSSGV